MQGATRPRCSAFEGLLVGAAAAHSTFSRSLLLSLDEDLVLDVLATSGRLAVEVDGIIAGYVAAGDSLKIDPVRAAAQVVRLGRTTFYERARRKLRVAGSAQVGDGDATDAVVVDNFEQSRYEVRLGGEVAGTLQYLHIPDHVELLHTEIDQAFQSRGLASRLAGGALDELRARSGRIVVSCPFVAGYLERHPEYATLVVPGKPPVAADRRPTPRPVPESG